MARIKNATFVGNPPSDVDVDAPTWARVLKNAIGDLALVYDKITGLNGEAELMTHDGTRGRGARLGIPWINQTFAGRDDRHGQWGIDLGYTNAEDAGSPKDACTSKDTIIFGVPVFIPPGETDMNIVITGTGLDVWPWRVQLLLESTGAELFSSEMTFSRHPSGLFDQLTLSTNDNGTGGASSGKLCLLLIFADTAHRQLSSGTTPSSQVRAFSLFAGPNRQRRGSSMPLRASSDEYSITAGAPFAWRDFDATLIANRSPVHSYLTGGTSRNLNALIEYITGWPVGGNASYQLADSGVVNPATSEFLAHSLSTFATEPEVAWPVMAQAFGAAMLDGNLVVEATPPTQGMLDWYALMPIATAVSRHAAWRLEMPDFVTASSKLKACTLAISDSHAQGALWSTSFDFGIPAATSAQPFATVGASKLMTAKHSAIPFTADAINEDVDLRLQKSAAKVSVDEIAIMGTCFYFEP